MKSGRPGVDFPGIIAGASLKLVEAAPVERFRRDFPGIIAGASLKPLQAGESSVNDIYDFPGIIAGASLKLELMPTYCSIGRPDFPGIIAGASLKQFAELVVAHRFDVTSPALLPGPH